jgi:isopenicillin-N N-acyltransferase like protein
MLDRGPAQQPASARDERIASLGDGIMLTVEGNPKQRGVLLGTELRDGIAAHLEALFASWRRSGIERPDAHARAFLSTTNFQDAIVQWAPALMAEIEGLACGAGLPIEHAYLIQLLDEEWAYRKSLGIAAPSNKCSSAALRDEAGGTCIGQNMDLGNYTDGLQRLVLHREPGQSDQMVFTLAGMIGLMGVSAGGLAICVNAIRQSDAKGTGLPVAFVIRRLLQEPSADAAADLLRRIPHATSQHYLIADRHMIISLEARPDRIDVVSAYALGCYLHTNHPLGDGSMPAKDSWKDRNSLARLATLEARLGRSGPDMGRMADALASRDDLEHPICQEIGTTAGVTDFTTGSLISMLSSDGSVCGVWSSGPPVRGSWQPWSLNRPIDDERQTLSHGL